MVFGSPSLKPVSRWAGLMVSLGLYAALAFYGLDRQSLWEDEYLSIRRAWSDIPIWKDGHGFLYFALLQGWMGVFGDSGAALRTLSASLGLIAVCLFYQLSATAFNRHIAGLGTVVFASSPFLIWYSQEVRYITLTLVMTLLTTLAFQRLLQRASPCLWLAYGASLLLTFFSFLATWPLALAHGLYLCGARSRWVLLRTWIACLFIVSILFGAWFLTSTHYGDALWAWSQREPLETRVFEAGQIPTGAYNHVTLAVLPYTFFAFSTGFTLGPSLHELHVNPPLTTLVPHALELSFLMVLYGGLFFAGILAIRHHRDSGILLIWWMVIPIFSVFTLASVFNLFYNVRYVALAFPAYGLILALGLSACRWRWLQAVLFAAVLMVHSASLMNYYTNPRYAREDARSAAQYLNTEVQPQDAILAVGTRSALPFYYQGGPPIKVLYAMEDAASPVNLFDQPRERLWLIEIRPWQTDPQGSIKAELAERYSLVRQQHFPGVDIYAYQVAP